MKIEIEYEEVERLKTKISDLEKDRDELSKKLQSLDEVTLRNNAVSLAEKMFRSVFSTVCEKLGFPCSNIRWSDMSFHELEHWLGKNWWESEKLTVDVGATITTHFKNAFLHLGIKTEEKY